MAALAIKATGLVTAVGFNSAASCAAMRAGISGIKETMFWDSESGTFILGGKVDLPHWWEGMEKLVDLIAPAIAECLLAAATEPAENIPILLGVAGQDQPGRFENLEDWLLEETEFKLGLPHNPYSKAFPHGQVSGAHALIEAHRLIKAKNATYCIVAGVDSYLRRQTIHGYLDQRRILTESNSNGFIPGEAGSAVLVGGPDGGHSAELEILGLGMAREIATIGSEDPLRADGLTQAIRQALRNAGLTITDTAYRITDLTGEHYKFKESAFSIARFIEEPREKKFELWHPIEFLGEVGAAILPCLMAVGLHASEKAYAPGGTALCHVGSDDGQRAALVVRYSPGGSKQ